jgi:hypothetical protein
VPGRLSINLRQAALAYRLPEEASWVNFELLEKSFATAAN